MHFSQLDQWACEDSLIHRRDARAKILLLLIFLATVSLTAPGPQFLGFVVLCLAAILAARLPGLGILGRAAAVLPFSMTFAAISWLGGDSRRAAEMLAKSYISAAAAVTVVAATRLPNLLRGMEMLGAPSLLVVVIQFLYRYLFVLVDQGQRMRNAALCRGNGWPKAAGALSVLFARSHARAEAIHRAMLSRGYDGHFPVLQSQRFGPADWVFLIGGAIGSAGVYAASR